MFNECLVSTTTTTTTSTTNAKQTLINECARLSMYVYTEREKQVEGSISIYDIERKVHIVND